MGWLKKREKRAQKQGENSGEIALMNILLSNDKARVTKAEALNIPSVQGSIRFITGMVSMLPIKLYRENNGKAEEVTGDMRLRLLNDETGDALDAVQFWSALITDYFLGKGGYAYIRKNRNRILSLHYVDESAISVNMSTDPIFKDYELLVGGETYKPFEFIKLLRNSKNGAYGSGMTDENRLILSAAYNSLRFEENLLKNGGTKKGILTAKSRITEQVVKSLRETWNALYSDNNDNIAVLNDGIDFKEVSASSVEMQLNENKKANSAEICKLFNITPSVITGSASEGEYISAFRSGVMPVLRTVECALNRDLLLEKEKGVYYYAFDTKEMLKGDIKTRYEAYRIGIEANFLQADEVRYMEDLPALGLNWIKLGLDSVLYDVNTKMIYTPNTNKYSSMEGEEISEDRITQ